MADRFASISFRILRSHDHERARLLRRLRTRRHRAVRVATRPLRPALSIALSFLLVFQSMGLAPPVFAATVTLPSTSTLPPATTPLPSPLVIARKPSAWSVDTATGGELTLGYDVINTSDSRVGEVLLTTTLGAGVGFLDATPTPDVSGQTLAFVLPALDAFATTSVSVTMSLPAGAGPFTLDGDVRVFGNLRTRQVIAELEPFELRASLGAAPALLAPTLDAPTDDRDVLEVIGREGCTTSKLFSFASKKIAFRPYRGSLRGARGALWSRAGNSMDKSSVLVSTLRGCGKPARYVRGVLSPPRAQSLLRSTFPRKKSVLGGLNSRVLPGIDKTLNPLLIDTTQLLPRADEIADPENDPELLAEVTDHTWVEVFEGGAFVPLDPSIPGAAVGDSFAAVSETRAELDDADRHKIRFELIEEEFPLYQTNSLLAVAYHLDASDDLVRNGIKPVGEIFVQEVPVLDETLRTVELVGQPVSFGNFLNQASGAGTGVQVTINTYTPWMQVGDDPELIRGTDYQEGVSEGATKLIGKVVAGVFLRMHHTDPAGEIRLFEHELADRLGPAVRNGTGPAEPIDTTGTPIFYDTEVFTVNAPVSGHSRADVMRRFATWRALVDDANDFRGGAVIDQPFIEALSEEQLDGLTEKTLAFFIAYQRYQLASMAELGHRASQLLGDSHEAVGFLAAPQLHVAGARTRGKVTPESTFQAFIDLLNVDLRILPHPGQIQSAAHAYNSAYGLLLTEIESSLALFSRTIRSFAAARILAAARHEGIPVVAISASEISALDFLPISLEARARITNALVANRIVLVPTRMVELAGQSSIAWLEYDPTDGALIGVTEDGHNGEASEFAATISQLFKFTQYFEKLEPFFEFAEAALEFTEDFNEIVDDCEGTPPAQVQTCLANGFQDFILDFALDTLADEFEVPDFVKDFAVRTVEIVAMCGALDQPAQDECMLRENAKSLTEFVSEPLCDLTKESLDSFLNLEEGFDDFFGDASDFAGDEFESAVDDSCESAKTAADDMLKEQFGDPPLTALRRTSESTRVPVPHTSVRVDAVATLPGVTSSTGTATQADYLRLAGALTAPFANGDATLALHPGAVAGLGASGGLPTGGSSPNFDPGFAGTLNDADLNLEIASGGVQIDVDVLGTPTNLGFTGFAGTISADDAGVTDAVEWNGSFERFLRVDAGPDPTPGTQNDRFVLATPVLHSNADDRYDLRVDAPPEWDVDLAADGTATLTPPAGLAAGSFEVRVSARSRSVPGLAAEDRVVIGIVAPVPAIDVTVIEDPLFNVPQQGTLAMSAYRVEIANQSLSTDTFDVVVSGLPVGDFSLATDALTLGPAETGVVGLALHPVAGLPAPGTAVSFTASATGRGTALFDSDSASFGFPEVPGVVPSFAPTAFAAVPGQNLSVDLVLEATGNVASDFRFEIEDPASLAPTGIPARTTLPIGGSQTLPVSLSVPPTAPLGGLAQLVVTADLCDDLDPPLCTVAQPSQRRADLSVLVGTPESVCVLESAIEAAEARLDQSALSLQNLGHALSQLGADPGNRKLAARAAAAGKGLIKSLLANDLGDEAQAAKDLVTELASQDEVRILAALGDACTTLAGLGTTLAGLADQVREGVAIALAPASAVVAPGDDAVYFLRIEATGSEPANIDLAVSGLPATVVQTLSQTTLSLAPGESVDETSPVPITVTLNSPDVTPSALPFTVTARSQSVPTLVNPVQGLLAVRDAGVDVVAIDPAPRVVESPGDALSIAVEVLNRVNRSREVSVLWRAEDAGGTTVFSGTPIPATLPSGAGTHRIDLGALPTTGLPEGAYSVIAQLESDTGDPILGRQGRGIFFVGSPIVATATLSPAQVPPGTAEDVTSAVHVRTRPLTLPGSGFFDPFAKAVVGTPVNTTTPDAALGASDHAAAEIGAAGELILDMGEGLDRLGDGPGADLVVIERDPAECAEVSENLYEVAVSESPTGPWASLGSIDGARSVGDSFDLADATGGALPSARYVRITTTLDPVSIDGLLAAHTLRPNHIQVERRIDVGDRDGTGATPVVGDIDGDGNPEIAFATQTGPVQCEAIVVDGVTGAEDLRHTYPAGCTGAFSCKCGNSSAPAIANVDADPEKELVVYVTPGGVGGASNNRLRAINLDGSLVFDVNPQNPGGTVGTSVVAENLDADPQAEFLWPGGYVEDDGTVGLNASNLLRQPIALDVDGDGVRELVQTSLFGDLDALEIDGTTLWSLDLGNNTTGFSRPAVADLDLDGVPELILTKANSLDTSRSLTVVSLDETTPDASILWQVTYPDVLGTCTGNPALSCANNAECSTAGAGSCLREDPLVDAARPTVADLDGDGLPEIAVFVRDLDDDDWVIAYDGAGNELWRTAASDPGGDPPGVSSADLDGDGRAEVLWNGNCSGFTIFDGGDGGILYRDTRSTAASAEDHPIAADVDDDGVAEVVTGARTGLFVYGDSGWGDARSVWSHIDYRITNVEEDLALPNPEPESWIFHNTYLFQPADASDLGTATLEVVHSLDDDTGFDPLDIVPDPDSTAGFVVEWNETFPVVPGRSFSVPLSVPALAPGESAVVSEGTTVTGSLETIDGSSVTIDLPIEPTTVFAPHILGIAPEAANTNAGESVVFDLTLDNLRSVDETFQISLAGLDPGLVTLITEIPVEAGESRTIPLEIDIPTSTLPGVLDFVVEVDGDQGTRDEVWGAILVEESTLTPATLAAADVALSPGSLVLGPGGTAITTVTLTHYGSTTRSFDLDASLPAGVAGAFKDPVLTVAPGAAAAQQTVLALEAVPTLAAGTLPFTVTATATADAALVGSADGAIDVASEGVTLELAPKTAGVTPDSSVLLTALVTNTGAAADSFLLESGGLLGLSTCFGSTSPCNDTLLLPLAAGASQAVNVVVVGLPNLLQENTLIAVQATSQNNTAITDQDFSMLDIAARRNVLLGLEPDAMSQSSLDPVRFSLRITNDGNVCDERYDLSFVSTPGGLVTTPLIESFLVPPQLTAAVEIEVVPPGFGDFTLDIDVQTRPGSPECPALPVIGGSIQASLSLTPPNVPPIADAGSDLAIDLGDSADLDGTGSSDPDAGPLPLTYSWTVTGVPPGSSIGNGDLTGAGTATPGFVPDLTGVYVLELEVSDGDDDATDSVEVEVREAEEVALGRIYLTGALSGGLGRTVQCNITNTSTTPATVDAAIFSTTTGQGVSSASLVGVEPWETVRIEGFVPAGGPDERRALCKVRVEPFVAPDCSQDCEPGPASARVNLSLLDPQFTVFLTSRGREVGRYVPEGSPATTGGACGLLGIEAVLLLAALGVRRRRRAGAVRRI